MNLPAVNAAGARERKSRGRIAQQKRSLETALATGAKS